MTPFDIVAAISTKSRMRKFELFMEIMKPARGHSVLDIGVDPGGADLFEIHATNFFEALYPWSRSITALGLHDGEAFRAAFPRVRYVKGNAVNLPFMDRQFDIVFSNAVIEHVGGPMYQDSMADEVRRVSKRYFVTTPNRLFPIETHTRLPFVHWLPQSWQWPIYERAGHGWANADTLNLLGPRELRMLFPEAEIINLGMTLVATNGRKR